MFKMLKQQRLGLLMLSVLCLFALFSLGNRTQAAEYPVKPIILVVDGEPGSQSDILMRPLAKKLSAVLGKPVIIVNKPGAAGSMALKELHDAKPDGYYLGVSLLTLVSNKLQGISPYDHRDFSVICFNHVSYPILIASAKSKHSFKTAEEAISFAKAHPGEVSIATSGVGYIWWIGTMALQDIAKVKFNVIPQPGTSAAVATAVAGGHMDLGMNTLGPTQPQIDAGNVRFLVMFGPKRAPSYPDVRTAQEALGFDLPVTAGQLILGPPKMPAEIIDKLTKAWQIAARDPEYQRVLIQTNTVEKYLPPDQALTYLDGQQNIYRSVMDKAGILKKK
jgi:tripartite-type tricarboxylate transporter receptor subunit TctC